jgi:HEAT repeat protein
VILATKAAFLFLLLLACAPLRAGESKSVADMTPAELEAYLNKGKQSQLAPVIAAARDPKNKTAGDKAAELYSRLRSMKPVDVLEVPVLLQTLEDPAACRDIQTATKDEPDAAHCRVALLDALALIGPPASAAAGPLTKLLSDDLLRCHAALALGKIKPSPSPVPALTASLRAGNECAIDALGDLGPAAKGAVPLLAGFLKNRDFKNKARVAAALVAIGTPGTLAAVDQYHREEALAAKAVAAGGEERAQNWLKSQPWSANEVLTAAGKCKVAEDRMALAAKNKTPDYDAAFSSGQKTCLTFSEEYSDFSRAYGAGALPYLWRYCGENHEKKLCAAMQTWIETHQ